MSAGQAFADLKLSGTIVRSQERRSLTASRWRGPSKVGNLVADFCNPSISLQRVKMRLLPSNDDSVILRGGTNHQPGIHGAHHKNDRRRELSIEMKLYYSRGQQGLDVDCLCPRLSANRRSTEATAAKIGRPWTLAPYQYHQEDL